MEIVTSLPKESHSLIFGVLVGIASGWYLWETFGRKDVVFSDPVTGEPQVIFPERTFDNPVSTMLVTSEMLSAVEENRKKAGEYPFSYLDDELDYS